MIPPTCGFTADDQVAFAYGELPPDRAPAFAAHLIGCPTCRQMLSELHQAAQLCRRARETVVPTPVWHKPFPKPTTVWWQRPPVWAPALMVATAAAVWLLLLLVSPAGVPRVFLPALTPREVIPFSPARPLEVIEVGGFATRTAPGGAQAWPLQKGDLVRDGDVVSATAGLQLRLHDGSQVRLRRARKAQNLPDDGDQAIDLAAGHFQVLPLPLLAHRAGEQAVEPAAQGLEGIVDLVGE